jgi:heme-degrading monooxygenase HmoA
MPGLQTEILPTFAETPLVAEAFFFCESECLGGTSNREIRYFPGGRMIARIWHGFTRLADKETYYDYLLKTGIPEYKETKGNRGVRVLRRVHDDRVEFLLITLWDSWDAIKAFAGEEYEKAVYYPEDQEFLLELEPHVTHYDLLEDSAQ